MKFGQSSSEEFSIFQINLIISLHNTYFMKRKILFICTVNRLRSKTAEALLKDNDNYEVKSAGTSPNADNPVTRELLEWADDIFVMEKNHRDAIHKKFPNIYNDKKIECLYIPDEYEYMDPELVDILKNKLLKYFKGGIENNCN